jgi:hypothetical protein
VTITEPSGNDGVNGTGSGHITNTCDAYNVLCAGGVAVGDPTTTSDDGIADFSSQGPSPGGRKKPDLVAEAAGSGGSGNMTVVEQRYTFWNRLERGDSGTSFASPQVAGAAAVLYGAGLTDPLVVKSILIDSATLGRVTPASPMGTQTGWQPDWGWGELNLDAAYGQRNNFAADQVGAQDVRFYRATASSGDRATLVWNRRVGGPLDQTASPFPLTLSDLDLFEYDQGSQALQVSSTSGIDNVEQVRAPASGAVVYKVKDQSSTVDGVSAEPFALAAKDALTPLTAPKPTVALSLDRSSARQGDPVTVTATLSNPSQDMAGSSAHVTLDLPAGLEAPSGGSTTWDAGTLAPGDELTHQWTVQGSQDGIDKLTAVAQDQAYGETFNSPQESATLDIDSTPPAPAIGCPQGTTTDPIIPVTWGATDASPIAGYDVEVSADGGPFASWLAGATETSGSYAGRAGQTYAFRVRATDSLGNTSDYIACNPLAIGFAPVTPGPALPVAVAPLPAAAHLKISRIVVGRSRLLVTGSLARAATGRVGGVFRAGRSGTARAQAKAAHGRYRLAFRMSHRLARARRGLLRISYSGDRAFATQQLSRRIARPR